MSYGELANSQHLIGIMNHMPIGVTIHKMDTELDHGPILYQRELTLGHEVIDRMVLFHGSVPLSRFLR